MRLFLSLKFLYLVSSLIMGTTVHAQITLTEADLATTGDARAFRIDSTSKVIQPGAAGANATWQYMNLKNDFEQTLEMIPPSQGQFANQFSSANRCLSVAGFSAYFVQSPTKLEALGGAGTLGSFTTYLKWNNPMTQLELPSTFNSGFTDQGSWQVRGKINQLSPQLSFIQDSFWVKRTTTRITSFDAFGKLILGADTFHSVLREKRIEYNLDTLRTKSAIPFPPPQWVLGFPLGSIPGVTRDTSITYNYWINNNKFSALEFTLGTNDSTNTIRYQKPLNVVLTAEFSTNFCNGDSVKLTAPAGYASYIWLRNGQKVGTGQTLTTRTPGEYYVWVRTSNDITSRSQFFTLPEGTVPTVTAGGPLTFCQGSEVVLTAAGGTTYTWKRAGTVVGTGPTLTVTESGVYTVETTFGSNCTGTSEPVEVVVQPLPPTPVITQQGSVLQASGSGTFQWYEGTNALAGQNNATFTPSRNGTYRVEVTNAAGCKTLSEPFNFVLTSRAEPWAGLRVYPNPVQEAGLTIEFDSPQQITALTLTAPDGRVVETSVPGNLPRAAYRLSTQGLAAGVYVLQLAGPAGTHRQKIIVSRQ
jgi:hypothetical protein